jgi:hypothetical protein
LASGCIWAWNDSAAWRRNNCSKGKKQRLCFYF